MTTSEYCDLTELPAAFCAHCLGHTLDDALVVDDEPGEGRPTWFTADWPGECCACAEPFRAGARIRRDPRGWLAECCREGQ